MKKTLSSLLLLSLLLSACTSMDWQYPATDPAKGSVALRAVGAPAVKAPLTGTTFPTTRSIVVSAQLRGDDAQAWFTGITFSHGGGVWSAAPQKYWPRQGSLDFLGYSAGTLAVTAAWAADPSAGVTLTVPSNATAQEDLVAGGRAARSSGQFDMVFHHALSLLTFSGYSDVAYDAAANTGVTVDGITLKSPYNGGRCAVTRSGDAVAFAWSARSAAADLATAPSAATHLSTSRRDIGTGLLVVPQGATSMTIAYTLHNGRDAAGSPVDTPLTYDYTATGTWEAGVRYNYDILVGTYDITVKATLEPWKVVGNRFYGTGAVVDEVGPSFDFSEVTEWWWRPDASSPYAPLSYKEGSWGDEVTFTQGGWEVTLSRSGGTYVLSFVDAALATPLTISARMAGTFTTTVPSLEYSLDGGAWTPYAAPVAVPQGSALRLRAAGGFTDCRLDFDGNYAVSGNIMSLLAKTGFDSLTAVPANAFQRLFHEQGHLLAAEGLLLPATTVGNNACQEMFFGCISLSSAPPSLPASTVGNYAYASMFYGCSALRTAATELPATAVGNYAYASMFEGCSALTAAPTIAAATLGNAAFYEMFRGCTALTVAPPELSATTVPSTAYYGMFWGCSSLTRPPRMTVTSLTGSSNMGYMFYGCSVLASTADITLSFPVARSSCCYRMFEGCKVLTDVPALPAATLAEQCYGRMFYGCTALTAAPALTASTLADYCYAEIFCNCSHLSSVTMLATDVTPYGCLSNWMNGVAASGTLTKAASTTLPAGTSGIPAGWTVVNQ